jgi:hypothetical protein
VSDNKIVFQITFHYGLGNYNGMVQIELNHLRYLTLSPTPLHKGRQRKRFKQLQLQLIKQEPTMTGKNLPNLEKYTTFILLHLGLKVNIKRKKKPIFSAIFLEYNIFYVCADSIYMKMMPMPLQGQL